MSGRLTSADGRALEELILGICRAAAGPGHWEVAGRCALSLIGLLSDGTTAQPRDLAAQSQWRAYHTCNAESSGVDLRRINATTVANCACPGVQLADGHGSGERLSTLAEHEIMQSLLPQLQRTYHSVRALSAVWLDAATGAKLLDRMGTGCVVLDRDSRVIHRNGSFERCLSDGFAVLRHDRIQFASRTAEGVWRQGLSDLAGEPSGDDRAFTVCTGVNEYFVRISRFDTAESCPDYIPFPPFAVAHITRAEPGREPSALLAGAFGLTAAETRVLAALLSDRSPKAIAVDLAVSEEAVRFHIRNLYRKTDTRGQLALINKAQRLLRRFAANGGAS